MACQAIACPLRVSLAPRPASDRRSPLSLLARYAWGDAFIVTMEAFTAFVEGPACWAIAYGMATTKAWRYPLMMLTSFGQFYGCLLYFLTSYYTELRDIRPEPLFFYFYFLIINLFWIVVPVAVCTHAWVKVTRHAHAPTRSRTTARHTRGLCYRIGRCLLYCTSRCLLHHAN